MVAYIEQQNRRGGRRRGHFWAMLCLPAQRAWLENNEGYLGALSSGILSSGGPNGRRKKEIVYLKAEPLERVRQECRNSLVVMPPATQVVMEAITGISLKLYSNGRWMEPNPIMQDYIDEVFLPFAQQQALSSFEDGLMSYSWAPWEADPRLLHPYLLREGKYRIGMRWKRRDIREYRVYRNKAGGGSERAARDARVEHVHLWKPRDDGSLSSPFALVLQSLERHNQLWSWYSDSVKGYSKPLLVFGGGGRLGGGGASSDPLEDDHNLPGDVSALHSYANDSRNQQRRKQFQLSMAIGTMKRHGIQISYNPVSQRSVLSSDSALYENSYLNPENENLQQVVTPSPIPDFLEAVKSLRGEMLEALMVPGSSKSQDSGTHAATAELVLRDRSDLVQQLQKLLSRPLGKIMEHMLQDVLDADLDAIYFEAETQQRAPLSKEQRKSIRAQRTRVELTFQYSPLTTYDSLKKLFDDEHINRETFGEYGLKVIGLPPGEALDSQEVRAQVREKRQLLELATPEYMKQRAGIGLRPPTSREEPPSSSSPALKGDGPPALKKRKSAPAEQ